MNVVTFYHSFLSDGNHGNAHFLRGAVAGLQERGHSVWVNEPADDWSLKNLTAAHGVEPRHHFRRLLANALEGGVLELKDANRRIVFWDVAAPATPERARQDPNDPCRGFIPAYDLILTYGGSSGHVIPRPGARDEPAGATAGPRRTHLRAAGRAGRAVSSHRQGRFVRNTRKWLIHGISLCSD